MIILICGGKEPRFKEAWKLELGHLLLKAMTTKLFCLLEGGLFLFNRFIPFIHCYISPELNYTCNYKSLISSLGDFHLF